MEAKIEYDPPRLLMQAESRDGRRRLEVDVQAPLSSFAAPVYVPTPKGFTNTPGCRDSFAASIDITAYERPAKGRDWRVVEGERIELGALEFGGEYQKLPDEVEDEGSAGPRPDRSRRGGIAAVGR